MGGSWRRMRIILDLTTTPGNRIEGTACWADLDQPAAFNGWLALMSLIEVAQHQASGGVAEP